MFFLPAHTRACSRFADVSSAGVPAAPVFKSNGKALSKMEAEKLQLALEKQRENIVKPQVCAVVLAILTQEAHTHTHTHTHTHSLSLSLSLPPSLAPE